MKVIDFHLKNHGTVKLARPSVRPGKKTGDPVETDIQQLKYTYIKYITKLITVAHGSNLLNVTVLLFTRLGCLLAYRQMLHETESSCIYKHLII
jgi:hypothetical protein